ncbi:MAG TPA: hypothetical protein VJS38_11530 [Phenylobacterium sp.]|uniref:hypothetical protein n=1 Tax=Phenylobacterium sp. TaxID=1871053 RepID=UPI002B48CB4A|nr:hypothetical protein [Phenylobacterium sp.]HKR88794.1 hypothetical protein [Phenylobacterium sp.]
MHVYFCTVTCEDAALASVSVIIARSAERARELARRELVGAARSCSIEIREFAHPSLEGRGRTVCGGD